MKRPELIGLKDAKQEGHDLVDRIVATGAKKDNVYDVLRARLGCLPGNEHFGQMFTLLAEICVARESDRAAVLAERRRLAASHRAQKRAAAPVQPTRKSRRAKDVLPLAEQRRIFAERKASEDPVVVLERTTGRASPVLREPWWKRWLHAVQAW